VSNPWWRRRKKKNPWFNDLYEELERLGDLIDETMQKTFDNSKDTPTKRKGFSVKLGPDGKPRIQEFDNRQPWQAESEVSDELEPLVDFVVEDETVVVLVVLPGVNKNDIDLRLTENTLTFSVDAADFEWYNDFRLPARVNPKSARASYKNGVLEIKVKKLEKTFSADKISLKK